MRALAQPRSRRAFLCGAIAVTMALTPLSSTAQRAVLMDADSGAIMFQRSGEELMHPASMSKLMLLAVVFKALKAGEVKLEDQFFMSEHAWRKGGAPSGTSAMFVPVGTKATLDELLKGIIVQSGND